MKKKLNFMDCMSFCIGQIVGSGVFVLTGIVIGMTGHGAPYAFLLAACISLVQLIPMAIMGSAISKSDNHIDMRKRKIMRFEMPLSPFAWRTLT